ncbi:hypothetical protein Tco_0174412 [Tanacetum coccineum]
MQADMENYPEWTYTSPNDSMIPPLLILRLCFTEKKLDSEFIKVFQNHLQQPQSNKHCKEIWIDVDNAHARISSLGKYVTNVKQNMISPTTPLCSDLYSVSKPTASCQKDSKKTGASTRLVDHWPIVAHDTTAPVLPSPSTSSPQPTAQSSNDALMATMTPRLLIS